MTNSTLASARTFPPSESPGWTITSIERESRYWVSAVVGVKNETLFERSVSQSWQWSKACQFIRWFSDGERRYAKLLWQRASLYLRRRDYPHRRHRKVWQEGLEVAMKIKGSQGNPRVEWVKFEHPWTAISAKSEVHANHMEAQNNAIRRHCSAYRRRQNLYAKTVPGLQRAITCQRLIHNWVRPHWGLTAQETPAMAMGFCHRLVSLEEFLNSRGFQSISN